MSLIFTIPGVLGGSYLPEITAAPLPWTPALLADLRGYWNPDSLGYSDGTLISSLVSDGATNTLAQATSGNRPTYHELNGKGVMLFDADDHLDMSDKSIANAAPYISAFAVVKIDTLPVSGTARRNLFNFGGAATNVPRAWCGFAENSLFWQLGSTATDGSAATPFISTKAVDTGTHVFVCTWNPSTPRMRIWLDGVRVMDLTPGTSFSYAAGDSLSASVGGRVASTGFGGNVGDCGVTRSIMGDFERQQLEGFCAHKFGIASQLPSDHPFKNAAPLDE